MKKLLGIVAVIVVGWLLAMFFTMLIVLCLGCDKCKDGTCQPDEKTETTQVTRDYAHII